LYKTEKEWERALKELWYRRGAANGKSEKEFRGLEQGKR